MKMEAPANLDLQTKVIVACALLVLPRHIVKKVLNSLNLPIQIQPWTGLINWVDVLNWPSQTSENKFERWALRQRELGNYGLLAFYAWSDAIGGI